MDELTKKNLQIQQLVFSSVFGCTISLYLEAMRDYKEHKIGDQSLTPNRLTYYWALKGSTSCKNYE